LGERGPVILKGFNPTNPHRGDAIIATFCWVGSTNIITAVSDHLTNGIPVGNTYTLVEYVTAGGVSMATYVAMNVQNFPDPNSSQDDILVVQADFSSPVTDGGLTLSAFSGVAAVQALGAHRSATGSGSSTTIASPGAIAVGAGALAYGVTLGKPVAGLGWPDGFTHIATQADQVIESDAAYVVPASAVSVNPAWTWYFNGPGTWLATVLSLKQTGAATASLTTTTSTMASSLAPSGSMLIGDAGGRGFAP
jgi:hypothetical protein